MDISKSEGAAAVAVRLSASPDTPPIEIRLLAMTGEVLQEMSMYLTFQQTLDLAQTLVSVADAAEKRTRQYAKGDIK